MQCICFFSAKELIVCEGAYNKNFMLEGGIISCGLADTILLAVLIKYNHGHNILIIFDVLPILPFTTSGTKSDYQQDLTTQEIRKVQNNVKISWNYTQMSSPPPKQKSLSIITKDSLKTEIELFPQCTISQSFSQIFCPWLSLETVTCF